MRKALWLTGFVLVCGAFTQAVQAAPATETYNIPTAGAKDCKGGLHIGAKASATVFLGCIVKGAAQLDLDSPDAASRFGTAYDYKLSAEQSAVFQANPHAAWGKTDGYVPIRFENVVLTFQEVQAGATHPYIMSGTAVSSNGTDERRKAVVIEMGLADHFFIDKMAFSDPPVDGQK